MSPTEIYMCGECHRRAPAFSWRGAWHRERRRREGDPAWNDDDYGPNYGLDDRMVCPGCGFVHADDDTSFVGIIE